MVNEKEVFQSKTNYYRERALNQINNGTNEVQDQMTNLSINQSDESVNEIDSSYEQFYPSLKRNFFKDCKMVLNDLLDKIENDQSNKLEHPLILNFKKESLKIINSYIDSACIEHNRALELSKKRSEYSSNEIKKRIKLFTDLQRGYEVVEADMLEYLGY